MFFFIDIPVIECFSEIIRRSAIRCFAHPEVHDIIVRIAEFLSENSTIVSSSCPEPPVLHSHLWMTTYNYLEYFQNLYQTVFEPTDESIDEMLVQIKSILECLSPFKVFYCFFSSVYSILVLFQFGRSHLKLYR